MIPQTALCLLLAVTATAADGMGLVRLGDPWRWRVARGEASAPPDAWRQAAFDDTAWAGSSSGFAFDYYGYEASVISVLPRDYSGLFLRVRFDVPNLDDLGWLILRVDWNGGFVAYLNGTEIARRNLGGSPGDWVPAGAAAAPRIRGNPEEIDISAQIPLLQPQGNVLALQWHNSLPLITGAGIVPELLANFTRGPFVQATTTTSQHIVWRTPRPTRGRVEYGPTPDLGLVWTGDSPDTHHVATLSDLLPDTTYFYRVVSEADGRIGRSPVASCRTFREQGPVRFVVTADVGSGTSAQQAVAHVIRDAQPDLVMINGDLIYPAYVEGLADLKFFSLYQRQMQSVPYFVSAGNHETLLGDPMAFFADFHLPTNDVSAAEHAAAGTQPEYFYSLDHGDAHFVVLYAPLQSVIGTLRADSAQFRWLEHDLASSRKPWKFLFLHQPLASSGPHGDDDYNTNGIPDPDELAAILLPVARRHGVQVVFSAHDHTYERFLPVGGVHRIVSGGGGASLYYPGIMAPGSVQFARQWHAVVVDVSKDLLATTAVDWAGRTLDQLFVRRAPPAPAVLAATWHTPTLMPGPANDGDGNRTGQTFDLIGEATPAVAGDFSNLGRLRVNYDHRFLYLGLERVAVAPNQDILLFVESPTARGRTNLVGLGNGRLDPDGEGADGLDFLENLAFAGFAPGIAAIVGDEFADATLRGFRRTNTWAQPWPDPSPTAVAIASGQGVFRLDDAFTAVPGARLQQFNRSPQNEPALPEQNADFIELAIPMAELGYPFEASLKVAAVVAANVLPDPAVPARPLDTGFLGTRLTAIPDGPVVIEPLEFRLGPDLDPDDDGLTTAEELAAGLDPARPDTDGDGLPDGWEVRFRLDPRSSVGPDGATGDPDADGMSNAAELVAGTDPRNASSALRLGATLMANGQLQLGWPTVPGRRYWIEETSQAGAPFSPVAGQVQPLVGSGEVELRRLPVEMGTGMPARWFRILVESE